MSALLSVLILKKAIKEVTQVKIAQRKKQMTFHLFSGIIYLLDSELFHQFADFPFNFLLYFIVIRMMCNLGDP